MARRKIVRGAVEKRGGSMETYDFAFGSHDVFSICTFPDTESATAFVVEVSSSGRVHCEATLLVTPEEIDRARGRQSGWQAPGAKFYTVLITDIVHSTQEVERIGDQLWHEKLDWHDEQLLQGVEAFGGRGLKMLGDGVLAVFESPTNAILSATSLIRSFRSAGFEVRAGLHAGEVEQREGDISCIIVHISQRVASCAGPSEVLVSQTVRDLVAGSTSMFRERGVHDLKGVTESLELFAVEL